MPSLISSGCSSETRRLNTGFSQIDSPDPVTELQREGGLLVGEAELLRRRPDRCDVAGRGPGPDQVDGRVEQVATALVGVDERPRRTRDRKRAVVARAVAHVAVQDVEVRRVAGAQRAVGEHVGVGAAALAGDGVDALHELRAHLVEHLVDERDAVVLAKARAHRPVELLVGAVDHRAGHVEQDDLVAGLDHPRLLHELLAVGDLDALALEREQDGRLDRVDPDRLAEQAALLELDRILLATSSARPDSRRHRAAQRRDPGAGAPVAEPRVVELVVARGGAEVPHDRLVALGEQTEAVELVGRPRPDVGRGDVADVGHVEAQQRPELGGGQQLRDAGQALLAQPVVADALLPVDSHRPVAVNTHRALLGCKRLQTAYPRA